MSLGTRLTLKTAVLILSVLVVAGVALFGLNGLNRDLDAALVQYDRLRNVYVLSTSIEQAQGWSRRGPAHSTRALQYVQSAVLDAEQLQGVMQDERYEQLRASLSQAMAILDDPSGVPPDPDIVNYQLGGALNLLASEIGDTTSAIEQIESDAEAHRDAVVRWVAITAFAAAALAIGVGLWQYFAVMNPLHRLQRGVERLASGDFADTIATTGDREFVTLGNEFNRMADELATLYNELEEKVRVRSAQLAQSERLASVGFLAAGVAHEINNPLAIIAGEAELALRALPQDATDEVRKGLETTRDEAFRCKAITQKLISLARPGSGEREKVDLAALANEVAALVRTLPQQADRRLDVQVDASAVALAEASQIKQVLLNLVINALEAIEPTTGHVVVRVSADDASATIAVTDNGKGMDAEAIGLVFQPFYTEKKSPTTPGLGLGLSISHAIIEDLGGSLSAASDGEGKGSTFTIELPLSENGTTH